MSKYRLVDVNTREVVHPGPFSDSVEAIKVSGSLRLKNVTWEEIPRGEEDDNSKN